MEMRRNWKITVASLFMSFTIYYDLVTAAPNKGVIIDIHNNNTNIVHEIVNDKFGTFKYNKYIDTEKGEVDHKFHAPNDVTYGCFSFYDPKGKYHVTFYVSDKRGYRPIPDLNVPVRVYPRDSADAVMIKFDLNNLNKENTEIKDYNELSFPHKCMIKQSDEEEDIFLRSQSEDDISDLDIKSSNEEIIEDIKLNAKNFNIVTTTMATTTTTKKKKIKTGQKKKSKERSMQSGVNRNENEKCNESPPPIIALYPYVISVPSYPYPQIYQPPQLQPLFFQAVQVNPQSVTDDSDKRYELRPLVNNPFTTNFNAFTFNTPSLSQLLGLPSLNHEVFIKQKNVEPKKDVKKLENTEDESEDETEDEIEDETEDY